MKKEERNTQVNTIEYILQRNQYQINYSLKQKLNKDSTTHQHDQKQKQSKWATFTYFGKEIRKIANVLKDTDIKIAYKTANTIQKHVQVKQLQSIQ
jgi:hypothetical protein